MTVVLASVNAPDSIHEFAAGNLNRIASVCMYAAQATNAKLQKMLEKEKQRGADADAALLSHHTAKQQKEEQEAKEKLQVEQAEQAAIKVGPWPLRLG